MGTKFRQTRKGMISGIILLVAVFVFTQTVRSQVTIGSTIEPAKGTLLDLKEYEPDSKNGTSTKGMIQSRVELTVRDELYPMYGVSGAEDADYAANKSDLKKKHTGLTVFNIANNGDFLMGLHIWDGAEWRKIDDSPVLKPEISSLVCGSASIIPNRYTLATPYEGVLTIPYLGGNGGTYEGTAPQPVDHGLYIERIQDRLAIGGGEVMYRIFGTPTVSSPAPTAFNVEFLGKVCNVSMGSGGITSLYVKNLTSDVTVTGGYSSEAYKTAVALPFEEIIITEAGSYAFAVRLYGKMTNATTNVTARYPYYIYLQRNDKTNLLDAAEIDIVTAPQSIPDYQDYSYSIVLGGMFEQGDRVIISMGGDKWVLKQGSPASPVRTSLIYWKL
ncbi:MAG: hypothetical protein LBK97_06725 [Prevotellaceae bacterium]|jgi:hypothetical protein|nr:hypothetical protein [Prevotellaceae bacterium]